MTEVPFDLLGCYFNTLCFFFFFPKSSLSRDNLRPDIPSDSFRISDILVICHSYDRRDQVESSHHQTETIIMSEQEQGIIRYSVAHLLHTAKDNQFRAVSDSSETDRYTETQQRKRDIKLRKMRTQMCLAVP